MNKGQGWLSPWPGRSKYDRKSGGECWGGGKAYLSNEETVDFQIEYAQVQGQPGIKVSLPNGVTLNDVNSFSIMALFQIDGSDVTYGCFYGYFMGKTDVTDYSFVVVHGLYTSDFDSHETISLGIPIGQDGTIGIPLNEFGGNIPSGNYVEMSFFNGIITV